MCYVNKLEGIKNFIDEQDTKGNRVKESQKHKIAISIDTLIKEIQEYLKDL